MDCCVFLNIDVRLFHILQTYPPFHEAPLLGHVPEDYEHVQQYMQKSTGHRKVGTLSKSEWEAACKYQESVVLWSHVTYLE
jgi:hypothetical protein